VSISLLDVNVLVALFDPAHSNHEDAHRWFARNRRFGWATCPITINGCVRVLSNPAYPVQSSASEVAQFLHLACESEDRHFWQDSISLLDNSLLRLSALQRHQQITDAYLLGIAVKNRGRLATFDRSIPLHAVVGARPGNLAVIQPT